MAAIDGHTVGQVKKEMADGNIYLRAGSDEGILEEAPGAYKDVDDVIRIVCDAGLAGKVAKLTPIGVIKG